MSQAPAYPFPILHNSDIIQCMSELRIPMSEQELLHPTSAHISMVFESFVDLLMGVTREDLQQPQFSAMQDLEYPEVHEESFPRLGFYRAMQKLMEVSGMPDFTLKDINKPEYQRMRKILSAIINFAKFREERLGKYQEFIAQTDELSEKKQILEMKNDEYISQISALKAAREKQQPEIDQLETELKTLEASVHELNQHQATLQSEIRLVKDQESSLEDQLANDKFIMMSLKEDVDKLNSQVVRSPDRIRKELSALSNNLELEEEGIVASEKKSRDLLVKLDSLDKVEDDIQRCMKFMEEIQKEMTKLSECVADIENCNDVNITKEQSLKELSSREQHAKRQISSTKEKLIRLEKQYEMRKADANCTLEKMKNEKEGILDKLQKKEQQYKQLRKQLEDLKKSHENDLNGMREEYNRLHEQVGQYHQDLLFSLAEAV